MLGDASDSGHVPHADSAGNHERMFDWIREVPMPARCRAKSASDHGEGTLPCDLGLMVIDHHLQPG